LSRRLLVSPNLGHVAAPRKTVAMGQQLPLKMTARFCI